MRKAENKSKAWAWFLWSLILGAIVFFTFLGGERDFSEAFPWQGYFFSTVSLFMLLYILFGAVSAAVYKPVPALDDDELPGCTVIVPAYNEGRHAAETLFSLLNSDYPPEKLQIIAINDGSKDDTLEWLHYAASRSNGRVTVLDLLKNGGKKHALHCGFNMAKHDIVVTVDSDSIVTEESLRNIVSAFNESAVGGVAGNIRIKNLSDGMIPRMMDVGFMFGFEIIRSAQSLIGYVMCTPGALSAYRKSVVMPFIDEWLFQRFLGAAANIGEDRALATMILQRGYRVTFQSNAVAFTCIPYTYGKFCRMLLRWLRSDVRENLLMLFCFFRSFNFSLRFAGFAFHLGALIVTTLMPLFFLPVFFLMLGKYSVTGFFHVMYYSIVLGFISALIPAVIYARRVSVADAVWAPFYSFYNMFLLWWIPVYAFFTARNSNWLTREICPGEKKRNDLPQ